MRKKVKNRHFPSPDPIYHSIRVEKFTNYVMQDGKKDVARKIVYEAFEEVKNQLKTDDPVEVFEEALRNVGPLMEVRSRRVGGANYQVPREVRPERRLALAIKWILGAAQAKSGTPFYKRLANELVLASKSEGDAVQKRENVHKMAESNRAFAHFAW